MGFDFMKVIVSILILLISLTSACGQTRKDSLLVFIGQKIEVKNSPEKDVLSMDSRYIAKYKVLQLIHGSYKQNTIEFIVFDHYGEPAFSKYKTVLLFVSYYEGKLYHEKYQYFPLYLTTDNKWASPYSSGDYNHPFKDSITVKPENISFKEKIPIPINNLSSDDIQTWFPKPYYEIKNGKAIPVYGNYVDDLFKLKQQTILKARGIY